jgi:hypothetical protein
MSQIGKAIFECEILFACCCQCWFDFQVPK